jgi:uncharacterized protein
MSSDFSASRSSTFGYICRRCSRCCQNKYIQLDPYEVARLARARNEKISQFRAAWTINGEGTALRQKQDGTCVFLGPQGCEVHPHRPLVCRLYPLGRHLRSDGFEYYTMQEGHPLSEGEFTEQGTIADYLESQGAKPYLAAQDGYFQWICWAHEQLDFGRQGAAATAEGSVDLDLLDMDSMIAKHCAATGELEPEDIDDRLQLHLKLLYDAVANLEVQNVEGNEEADQAAALQEI